ANAKGCGTILRPQSRGGFLKWAGQRQRGSAGRRSGVSAIDRDSDLHDMHPRGSIGADFDRGVRAHDRGYGRESVLRQELERGKTRLCVDQRRLGTSLLAELLPPAEPQPRLAEYHGEIDFGPFEEMPLAHA